MKFVYILLFSCFFLLFYPIGNLKAQSSGIVLTGNVIDSESKTTVPFATVAVKSTNTNDILSGTVTDSDGNFSIEAGIKEFYLEISFIGYKNQVIENIDISNTNTNVGSIEIEPDAHKLNEVFVRGEKSTVEFKLDKRVFNVGKDLSTTGMGALEVLNNVPSVNVDIEGQISLRGSVSVQVLINGKPSVLTDERNNALSSITADMIESIEVITNPSAKYEAEGTAGIINIILKKEEARGFNGSATLNTGLPHNHNAGISLNRRTDHFNFFTQFGGGYRSLPRYRESVNRNYTDNTELHASGTEYRNEKFYNMTLGADYYINELNIFTLSGNYAYEFEDQPSETNYLFYNNTKELLSSWRRNETTAAGNPKWQFDLQYEKQFRNHEDHKLLLIAQGNFFGKELTSDFTNTPLTGEVDFSDQRTESDFHQANYIFKTDYTDPLSEKFTLEAGAAYEINNVGNEYIVFNQEDDLWIPDTNLTNNFTYDQKVLGVYSTGAYEGEKWGAKLGLRVEHTDLHTLLVTTNEENNQYYFDFFPTAHTSYKINKLFSLQAGYSRRIYRPRLWDLNPFFNIRDQFNIRKGNPNLKPEYSDSYEFTGILSVTKASFNASIYHLFTSNMIERITMSEDNVTVRMPMNVGTNKKTGASFYAKYNPFKWGSLNADLNYGYFLREEEYDGQSVDFYGDQWFGKMTTKFKFETGTEFELTGHYQSEVKTVQGKISGAAYADAGFRQKIKNGKIILSLSVRDIFNSRGRRSYIEQADYSYDSYYERGRMFSFGVSYGIGKGEAMTYSGRRR